MPLALGFHSAPRGALHNLSQAFSQPAHARPRGFGHAHGARRSAHGLAPATDVFARRSRAAPEGLYASQTDARLRASSHAVTRVAEDTGTTTTVQRDRVDFRLRSSQSAVGEDAIKSIGDALAGQAEALGRVLDAAGLLGDFNLDFADEFLARIGAALEELGGEGGFAAGAVSLDVKIRARSESVRVENGDQGAFVERSVQRIDIQVRFLALGAEGEVEEPQGPLAADVGGAKGSLRGLGPLAEFDLNGDGALGFDDIVALADEVLE